jgi:hypothetical protein
MSNELKEGIDWIYLIPENEETTVNLKLLSGEFKETIYQYGKVGFEPADNDEVYLKFVYNIVETPYDKESLESSLVFKNHIGDILVNIMAQRMEEGLQDEVGTDYSEESDTE